MLSFPLPVYPYEILLYSSVQEGMTCEEVVSELFDCLNSSANHLPLSFTDEEIKSAIRQECDFVNDLELESLDDVYLYVYLRWEKVEDYIHDYEFKSDQHLVRDYEEIDRI